MEISLSGTQYKVLRLWVLGGADAIFTRGATTARLIYSLQELGVIDDNGPTQAGIDHINREEDHWFANHAN